MSAIIQKQMRASLEYPGEVEVLLNIRLLKSMIAECEHSGNDYARTFFYARVARDAALNAEAIHDQTEEIKTNQSNEKY